MRKGFARAISGVLLAVCCTTVLGNFQALAGWNQRLTSDGKWIQNEKKAVETRSIGLPDGEVTIEQLKEQGVYPKFFAWYGVYFHLMEWESLMCRLSPFKEDYKNVYKTYASYGDYVDQKGLYGGRSWGIMPAYINGNGIIDLYQWSMRSEGNYLSKVTQDSRIRTEAEVGWPKEWSRNDRNFISIEDIKDIYLELTGKEMSEEDLQHCGESNVIGNSPEFVNNNVSYRRFFGKACRDVAPMDGGRFRANLDLAEITLDEPRVIIRGNGTWATVEYLIYDEKSCMYLGSIGVNIRFTDSLLGCQLREDGNGQMLIIRINEYSMRKVAHYPNEDL